MPTRSKQSSDQQLKTLSASERVVANQEEVRQFLSRGEPKKTSNEFIDLFAMHSFTSNLVLDHNCDNLIGSVEIPVGVAGPVPAKIDIIDKKNNFLSEEMCEFLLPLATLEGALVASINRGCKALAHDKSCSVLVQKKGMSRAPVFGFQNHHEATRFVNWLDQLEFTKKVDESIKIVSSHLIYQGQLSWQVGSQVFVRFVFDTDQAMGMNMVTLATDRIWKEVIAKDWPSAQLISLSGNMCVDKKPAALNRLLGRGYWVDIEAQLSAEIIQKVLKTDSLALYKTYYWKNVVGSNLAGATSINMQAANAVAAIFLATGQDMAHVAECSQADLFLEIDKKSTLNINLRMPNVNVGVIGGGTGLPCFVQARKMMVRQNGHLMSITSEQLAAATALAVLAGELSGLAALSVNQLAQAHQKLGRSKIREGHSS